MLQLLQAAVRQPSAPESGACDFYDYFDKPSAFVRNGTTVYFGSSYSGASERAHQPPVVERGNPKLKPGLAHLISDGPLHVY
jgi:hypothetical protein